MLETLTRGFKSARSHFRGVTALREVNAKLEAQGDSTVMHYSGDAQVGGRLASVGQRLMESSAQALIRQSLEALEAPFIPFSSPS